MNTGRTIFSQLVDHVPFHEFCKCVKRYNGDRKVKSFSCWEQFLCMSFAQLTYRESLRAIQGSFRAVGRKLYHMGIRGNISRNIPSLIIVTSGKVHEVNILDDLFIEVGAIYIMDRGYLDFTRLHKIQTAPAFFVIPAKSNFQFRRIHSLPIPEEETSGVRCDQMIALKGFYPKKDYPERLRRISYYKQHLRIESFYGTTENAVKTQIWIAISIYVLVAIVKKRLKVQASLYTILQILSITLLEKMPILQALTNITPSIEEGENYNQLNLFN